MRPDALRGSAALTSDTVRPAEKGANRKGIEPATKRRLIDAIVEITGERRKTIRAEINAITEGAELDALMEWLHRDPTAVRASRRWRAHQHIGQQRAARIRASREGVATDV